MRNVLGSIIGIAGLVLLALVWGFFIEPNRLVVNQHEIRPDGWEKAHDGLRIVVISDLHGGARYIDKAKLKQVVETANAQGPDLIVLLGDFVSQVGGGKKSIRKRPLKMPVEEIAGSISGFRAKYGVFAVIGNHDDWYGRDEVTEVLENVGIKVLVDELATVQIRGTYLHLLGMRDFMSVRSPREFSDQARKLASEFNEGSLIILDHSPDVIPFLTGENPVSARTRLILAGHTHGGQVWLPLIGSPIVPSNFGQRYAFGHVKSDGVDVFITTGIGTSILPVRFLVPPEIAVLTLRSG